MSFKHALMSLTLALPLQALAGFTPFTGPSTWDNSPALAQHQMWADMNDLARDIADDINLGGREYRLEYKVKGGSSHQAFVKRISDDKVLGLWSAPNHATYTEGEIFAFNVSRLLGRSQWSTHAVRMTFEGRGRTAAFNAMNASNSPKSRACNKESILTYMRANTHYVNGVFKGFRPGEKPEEIPELVDRVHKARFNLDHRLIKMTKKSGPRPTGAAVYLAGNRLAFTKPAGASFASTDAALAKQLSFLALVDALNSQRDRFGPYGSNMEAMVNSKTGSFTIANIDNGGISDAASTSSLNYFVGATGVSRFEREVFNKVIAYNNFIQKGVRSPLVPYRSVAELKLALGYETYNSEFGPIAKPASCSSSHAFLFNSLKARMDVRWKNFTVGLNRVATHMSQFSNDPSAFF